MLNPRTVKSFAFNHSFPSRHPCYLLALAGCCLIFLMAACGSGAMQPTKGRTTPKSLGPWFPRPEQW